MSMAAQVAARIHTRAAFKRPRHFVGSPASVRRLMAQEIGTVRNDPSNRNCVIRPAAPEHLPSSGARFLPVLHTKRLDGL